MMTEGEALELCPRCKGRMLPDGPSGDHSCFTCGHVRYREPAERAQPNGKRERRPSHAGQSLG